MILWRRREGTGVRASNLDMGSLVLEGSAAGLP